MSIMVMKNPPAYLSTLRHLYKIISFLSVFISFTESQNLLLVFSWIFLKIKRINSKKIPKTIKNWKNRPQKSSEWKKNSKTEANRRRILTKEVKGRGRRWNAPKNTQIKNLKRKRSSKRKKKTRRTQKPIQSENERS